MRYTTSYNQTYRFGLEPGYVPKPWIETEAKSEQIEMWSYLRENVIPWDADTCDNGDVLFHFDSGNMYKVDWSYWIEHEPEWSIQYEYFIEEIDEVPSWMKTERDWI